MTEPATFTSATSRHALPFLFAGQAQKEFTLNEALALIDILMHPAIVEERSEPPSAPTAGDIYLVATPAAGAFAGHEDQLAAWDGQQWSFLVPTEGMVLHEISSGSSLYYRAGWQRHSAPPHPTGGTVIDVEARDTIVALIDRLENIGIFS